jgi:hypothetical protein
MVMAKSHRVQALLDHEQFSQLEAIAERQGTTISALIRQAVEVTYMQDYRHRQQQAALQSLTELQAPTADWPDMKSEIVRGALGG